MGKSWGMVEILKIINYKLNLKWQILIVLIKRKNHIGSGFENRFR